MLHTDHHWCTLCVPDLALQLSNFARYVHALAQRFGDSNDSNVHSC